MTRGISNVEGKRPFDALRLLRAASPFPNVIRTPKRASGLKNPALTLGALRGVVVPTTAKQPSQ